MPNKKSLGVKVTSTLFYIYFILLSIFGILIFIVSIFNINVIPFGLTIGLLSLIVALLLFLVGKYLNQGNSNLGRNPALIISYFAIFSIISYPIRVLTVTGKNLLTTTVIVVYLFMIILNLITIFYLNFDIKTKEFFKIQPK